MIMIVLLLHCMRFLLGSMFVLLLSFLISTATAQSRTLSLHDALPIFQPGALGPHPQRPGVAGDRHGGGQRALLAHADRKSTRLNSSHVRISYAVFCLKKKLVMCAFGYSVSFYGSSRLRATKIADLMAT